MREYAQGDRKRAMQTWSEGSTASIVAALLAFNLGAANGDLSGITVGSTVGIVAQRSCSLTGCWLLPPTHVFTFVSQQQPLRASKCLEIHYGDTLASNETCKCSYASTSKP